MTSRSLLSSTSWSPTSVAADRAADDHNDENEDSDNGEVAMIIETEEV